MNRNSKARRRIALCLMVALLLPLLGAGPVTRAVDGPPNCCTGDHSGYTGIADETFFSACNYTVPAGSYYLSADIDVAHRINFSGTVNLCLNGHVLRGTATAYTGSAFLMVNGGAHLTILDCKSFLEWDETGEQFEYLGGCIKVNEGGEQISEGGAYALQVSGSGSVCDFYAGSICDSVARFGAVLVNSGATMNMYDDASIRDNDCHVIQTIGGGIDLQGGATFNMYGGRIEGNKGKTGGGVALANPQAAGSTFNMYDGEIVGNEATGGPGGGVTVVAGGSQFNMYGGRIADNSSTSAGGGIHLANVAGIAFHMYGGEISGNKVGGNPQAAGASFNRGGTNVELILYRGEIDGPAKGGAAYPFTVNGAQLSQTGSSFAPGVVTTEAADYDLAAATLTVKDELTALSWADDAEYSPTIRLEADLPVFHDVPDGQTVSIELDGHTLDAGPIANSGTLLVSDSSEDQDGKLLSSVTGSGTCLRLDRGLRVGYGKAPITPEKIGTMTDVSLPMAGYGDNINRRPLIHQDEIVRIDDNGDGVVDEQDGQFATCIAIQDAEGHTLLLISADTIGATNGLVNKLKKHAASAFNVDKNYIYLNASHTHSGVDLGWYFSYVTAGSQTNLSQYDGDTFNSSYNNLNDDRKTVVQNMQQYVYGTLLPGLLNAAEQALDDLAPAAMSVGTVDTVQMNFIRHAYRSGTGGGATGRVYGVNTRRSNGDGSYETQYNGPDGQGVNNNMYLLQFRRPGKASVVAVDWRAHATSVSTSGSSYGLAHRNRISSDYINSFRRTLEQKGYQVSFFQGTSGNVNTVSLLGSSQNVPQVKRKFTHNGTTNTGVVPYLYGRQLAAYALQGLEDMTDVSAEGGVQSYRRSFTAQRDTSENFKMMGGDYPDGIQVSYTQNGQTVNVTHVDGMLIEQVTDHENETMSVYSYLQKYYAYVTTPASEKTQVDALIAKYNLNSVYHLNRVKTKFNNTMTWNSDQQQYVPKSTQTDTFDLYAFSIGNEVNAVTGPFELFDYPYTFRREAGYGKFTFVLGYTNGSWSYLPTEDTFTFARGRGAYEANNTAFEPGTAEAVGQRHQEMLAALDRSGLPEMCPYCGRAVTWEPFPATSGDLTQSGHFYLPRDTSISQINIPGSATVCLHLNGHKMYSTGSTTSRAFAIQGTSTLNVMGEGQISARGVVTGENSYYKHAGVILVNPDTTLNLYGGTIKRINVNGQYTQYGGTVYVSGGTMNMYGGTLTAETADGVTVENRYGGVLAVGGTSSKRGTFRMYSGTISGGRVQEMDGKYYGHNVYVSANGNVDLYGGAIVSEQDFTPSVYLANGSNYTDHTIFRETP